MMETDWESDFPLRDEVEDCTGNVRAFLITCHEGAIGYAVRATEQCTGRAGYEFGAYSETSPYAALGRVRQKMHRALATRHITRSDLGYQMLHDELRGRITWDADAGLVVVVDGIALDMQRLASILASHEGWSFEMRIVDSLE